MTTVINPLYVVDSGSGGGGGGVTDYGALTATATGATTARTGADRAADLWDVRDWGCIADGTSAGAGTDNAAALQAAINGAHAIYVSTGQPVGLGLGSGMFALASAVVWKDGVKLYGPGSLVTKGASTYSGAAHALITASNISNFGFYNVEGWGVGPDQKLAGPMSDSSGLGARDSFLDADGCTNLDVENCTFFRFQSALIISHVTTLRVIGNYLNSLSAKTLAQLDAGTFTPYSFTGDQGSGIRLLGERGGIDPTTAQYIVISNNVVITVGLDIAIDLTSQSGYPCRANVTGNFCAGTNSGIQVYTSGAVPVDPGTLTTTDRATSIVGNYCFLTYQQGIYIRGVEGVACTANKVVRCALIGTFVGGSAGGILNRATTNATYPTSPVSHDLPNLINDNQVIDCGDPATGILDAGIRCDTLNVSVQNNQVFRSFDRFGSNVTANGTGIRTINISPVAQFKSARISGNKVRGFSAGIDIAFSTKTVLRGTFSCSVDHNDISEVLTGITVDTSGSGYQINDNNITEVTTTGISLRNSPYSEVNRNLIDGAATGIIMSSGNSAGDFYSTGTRNGPTVQCNDNKLNNCTTPISIPSTATGDISIRSRCYQANNNLINGVANVDSTTSFTYTAAPTASDYRSWHVGDLAPIRAPTSATPGWYCTGAGSFGAAIATTASATSGSPTLTFSGATAVVPDDYLTVVGLTGNLRVLSVNIGANTCVVDQNASATVSGAAISRTAPTFSNLIPAATILGVTSGAAATAGQIGEVLSATVSTATNYTTTATLQQVTTLSITAGAWEITCFGTTVTNSATMSPNANAQWVIGTTTASASGTVEGSGDSGWIPQIGLNGNLVKASIMLRKVINISSTTSYFLNSQATFTAGNPQYFGGIVAVRIR